MDFDKDLLDLFNDEINETCEAFGIDRIQNVGKAFEFWIANKFLGFSNSECKDIVIGMPGDQGIDIGAAGKTNDVILLVQCKHSEKVFNNEKVVFDKLPILELIDGLKELEQKSDNSQYSTAFKQFKSEFKFSKKLKKPMRKIVCVSGTFDKEAKKIAREENIEIYEIENFLDFVKDMDSFYADPPSSIVFPVPVENFICRHSADRSNKAVFLPIHSYTIYEILQKYGDSIFAENLRLRLPYTRQSSIGRKIKETALKLLRSKDPKIEYSFEILNNGLNIVCDNIEISDPIKPSKEDNISPEHETKIVKFELFHPQIVNGCQTCWALHDAIQTRKSDEEVSSREDLLISNVYVWAKIIPTGPSKEFKEEITISSNTQNPITVIDYKANHPINRTIRKNLENYPLPIFYEYKRGLFSSYQREYKNKPELNRFKVSGRIYRKIGIEDFAQISMAWHYEPHIARAAKRTIFENDDKFEDAFNLENIDETKNDGLSWIETIIFGYAIKNIAEIIRGYYNNKDKDIRDAIQRKDELIKNEYKTVDEFIKNRNKFCYYIESVRYWNFLLISLLHGIVENYCKYFNKKKTRRNVYKEIFDINDEDLINLIFNGKELQKQFIYDDNLMSDQLIKKDIENEKLKNINMWLMSLTNIIVKAIQDIESKPGIAFTKNIKNFIEQKTDTYKGIIEYIKNNILGDELERERYFPGLD